MRLYNHLVFCVACLTVHTISFAAYTSFEAGKVFRDLLTSNYLMLEFKESDCIKYINPERLNRLINFNNNAIKNIENSLSPADYSELKALSDSDEQKIHLKRLSKTYISDEITSYKKEAGGMSFACGIAFGNVMHLQAMAMSGVK